METPTMRPYGPSFSCYFKFKFKFLTYFFIQSQIDQWLDMARSVEPNIAMWLYPLLGYGEYNPVRSPYPSTPSLSLAIRLYLIMIYMMIIIYIKTTQVLEDHCRNVYIQLGPKAHAAIFKNLAEIFQTRFTCECLRHQNL
jgi:hypothetical protein